MADLLEDQLGVTVEVTTGDKGELSVRVDGVVVARRGWLGFPADDRLVALVRQRLAAP